MKFPEDDRPLSEFLRHYRSPVPPPAADLEDRLLSQITDSQSRTPPLRRRLRPAYWAVPTAIAAGLIATLISYQSLRPKPPTPADEAKLEAFIETSWDGSLNSDQADYELLFVDTASTQ